MKHHILSALVILSLLGSVFIYTLHLRSPWFASYSESGHQWVTAHTLLVSKHWISEGPMKFLFGMPWNPNSIEFQNIKERIYYYSFPSGMVWPIYTLSKLLNKPPDLGMIMKYNQFNHILVALTISVCAYLLTRKNTQRNVTPTIFAVLSGIFVLLLPGPLYWFQNTYFTQEAVILPYALLILFEISKLYIEAPHYKKFANILESLFIFYGLFTDWLMVFVVIILLVCNTTIQLWGLEKIYFKKWLINNAYILLPSLVFVILFLTQTYMLGGLDALKERASTRFALSEESKRPLEYFDKIYWDDYVARAYGRYAKYIILLIFSTLGLFIATIIGKLALFKKKPSGEALNSIKIYTLVLIPSLLEIYSLKNHSVNHDFTALKLILPIALFLPLTFSSIYSIFRLDLLSVYFSGLSLNISNKTIQLRFYVVSLVLVLISLVYLFKTFPYYLQMFPQPNMLYTDLAMFVSQNSDYNDIYYSPNFEIPQAPPQRLSLSMKRVYFVESIDSLFKEIKRQKSRGINPDVKMLVLGDTYEDMDYEKIIEKSKLISKKNIDISQKELLMMDLRAKKQFKVADTDKAVESVEKWTNGDIYIYAVDTTNI